MNAIAQFGVEQLLAEMFNAPRYPFSDGKYREPTVGNRYQIKWYASAELEHYPCEYIGHGKFQRIDDGTGFVHRHDGLPFKLEPSEVEYIEDLSESTVEALKWEDRK